MHQESILNLANIDTNDFEDIKLIKPSDIFNLFSVRHKFSKKNFVAMVIKRIKSDVNYEQNIINHIFLMMSTQHLTTKKFYGFSSTDFNEQNNITIFMKIYNQKSIFDYIEEKRRSLSNSTFDNTTRLIILIGIAYSLNYFNQNTIFKCDDQFPNIFLDKHFRPHICDSILSRFNGQYQHNPKGFDNTIYKSPENIMKSVSDEKSFVYSIGILIYEILSDQIPYQSYQEGKLTQFQLEWKVSKENYRPSLDCPLSEHAKNLINRCLSSKPKNRPTFLEIFNELTNFDSKNENKIIGNVNKDTVLKYISEITIKTPTYETLIEQLTKYKLKLSTNKISCLKSHYAQLIEIKEILKESEIKHLTTYEDFYHHWKHYLEKTTKTTFSNDSSDSNDESKSSLFYSSSISISTSSINRINSSSSSLTNLEFSCDSFAANNTCKASLSASNSNELAFPDYKQPSIEGKIDPSKSKTCKLKLDLLNNEEKSFNNNSDESDEIHNDFHHTENSKFSSSSTSNDSNHDFDQHLHSSGPFKRMPMRSFQINEPSKSLKMDQLNEENSDLNREYPQISAGKLYHLLQQTLGDRLNSNKTKNNSHSSKKKKKCHFNYNASSPCAEASYFNSLGNAAFDIEKVPLESQTHHRRDQESSYCSFTSKRQEENDATDDHDRENKEEEEEEIIDQQTLYNDFRESYENNDAQLQKASFENYCRIKKSFLKVHYFYEENDTFSVIRYLCFNADLVGYPKVVPYIVFNLAQKFDKSIKTVGDMVDKYSTFSKECEEWIKKKIKHLESICTKVKSKKRKLNQSDQRFIVDFSNKILVVSIGLNHFGCENDFGSYEMSDFIDNYEEMIIRLNKRIDKFIRDYEYYKFIAPAEPENDEYESEEDESESEEDEEKSVKIQSNVKKKVTVSVEYRKTDQSTEANDQRVDKGKDDDDDDDDESSSFENQSVDDDDDATEYELNHQIDQNDNLFNLYFYSYISGNDAELASRYDLFRSAILTKFRQICTRESCFSDVIHEIYVFVMHQFNKSLLFSVLMHVRSFDRTATIENLLDCNYYNKIWNHFSAYISSNEENIERVYNKARLVNVKLDKNEEKIIIDFQMSVFGVSIQYFYFERTLSNDNSRVISDFNAYIDLGEDPTLNLIDSIEMMETLFL